MMCLQAFDLLACHVYARTVVRYGAEGKRVGDGVKKRGVKIMARVYHTTWLHGGDRAEKRDRVKKEMCKNHGMKRLGGVVGEN